MEKQSKSTLRTEFLKRRDSVPVLSRAHLSAAIHRKVMALPAWTNATTILFYVSIGSEVETRALIQEAFRLKKRVLIPLIDREWKETLLSELRQLEDLAPGPIKGIPEPPAHRRLLVSPSEVDLALIPGVAFDRRGGRLGFGGGFFDRLLPLAPKAARIALAFETQISPEPLPTEPHDVFMQSVITEDELIVVDATPS